MIKAISFDLDHTLYDRNATWDNLFPVFFNRFSDHIHPKMPMDKLLYELKAADCRATYAETSWHGMFEELKERKVFLGNMDFASFQTFIYEIFPDAIVPYSDTHKILAWCAKKGYRPSVITNGHPGLQERKIRSMGIGVYLEECIICNLDTGAGCKPEPDAFLELTRRLRLSPEEILYVGDNPINDIQGARNAKMKTAWLNVMDNWLPQIAPADYEISALCELQRILEISTLADK